MQPDNTERYRQALNTLVDIATAYRYAGRLDDAVTLLGQVAKIAEHPDVSSQDRVANLLYYGKLLEQQAWSSGGDYEPVLAVLERARELAEEAGNKAQIAAALDEIGHLHFNMARNESRPYDVAVEYFQRSVAIHEQVDDPLGECNLLFHYGLLNEWSDKPEEARDMYRRSRDIARQHDFKLEQSYPSRHLGFINQKEGNLETALEYFKESLALRQEIGFVISIPPAQVAVGEIYEELGDMESALEYSRRAYELGREINLSPLIMTLVLERLGTHYRKRGKIGEARKYLQEALDSAKQARSDPLVQYVEKQFKAIEGG